MLCENCKSREANIRYTEVINGVKTEHNLCSQCAREMDMGHYSAIFDRDFPLAKLLSSLLGLEESNQKEDKLQQISCPVCRTSYQDFVENSRFGCPDCYNVFDLLIGDKIKKLQGNDSHKGKTPKFRKMEPVSAVTRNPDGQADMEGEVSSREETLALLKARLQEAIEKEEYEEAAGYRDQIRALKREEEQNA